MALLLVQPLAWGKLDRQPATGYLLGQFTMPWEEKLKGYSSLYWYHFKNGTTVIYKEILDHVRCTCAVSEAGCAKLRLWVDESILVSDISLPDRTDVTLLAIPAGPMEKNISASTQ